MLQILIGNKLNTVINKGFVNVKCVRKLSLNDSKEL